MMGKASVSPASVLILLFLVLLAPACGAGEPETDAPSEALVPELEAGAVVFNSPALDEIVPANYRIEKLRAGFTFTEGPLWVEQGGPYLLFSDVRENAIYKWSPDGTVSDFLTPIYGAAFEEGRFVGPSGLTLDAENRLVFTEYGNGRITRRERDGSLTVLVDNYGGKPLNSPNDLVYRSDGSLYFTDPPFGFLHQDDDPLKQLDFNGVFRLRPDGELELLSRSLTRPNGIAFSPDERTLYISNSDPNNKLWMAFDVNEDGSILGGRVFHNASSETAPGLPDGLKVDTQGNVYAAGPGGVWVFNTAGTHLGTIQPEETPANLAWGDGDGKTLYMTARTGIYRVRLNVEGIRP